MKILFVSYQFDF